MHTQVGLQRTPSDPLSSSTVPKETRAAVEAEGRERERCSCKKLHRSTICTLYPVLCVRHAVPLQVKCHALSLDSLLSPVNTHSRSHTLTPSHTNILTPSHTNTLTHSHIHTLTLPHPHTLTPSHPHTLTQSTPHSLIPTHPHSFFKWDADAAN